MIKLEMTPETQLVQVITLLYQKQKMLPLKQSQGRVRWLKPVILALWEAEAGGSRGQQIETIVVNMVKPRLY